MSDEGIRNVAAGLRKAGSRAEAQAFKDELEIKVQGEKAAHEVIIRAVETWTGHPINSFGQLPMVRDGEHVGYMSTRLASMMYPLHDVTKVAREVWAEKTPTIRSRRNAYQKLFDTLESALNQIGEMNTDAIVNLPSTKKSDPANLEEKLVLAMGSKKSVIIGSSFLTAELQEAIGHCDTILASRSSGRGRPREEAKYKVAQGFAKIYAKVTGERPTYSEDENGLHGRFTPALRKLFDAIGWDGVDLAGPANAACQSVEKEDLDFKKNSTLG